MIKILTTLITMTPLLAQAHEFKLLSWNVFMIPKPINFSKQVERTRLISQKLQDTDHDIILFQEAFRAGFKEMIAREFKEKYPYQASLNRRLTAKTVLNSGLYIASKYPIEVLGHHYFTKSIHADQFSSKGVLLVELTLPNEKKVQIATTHVQAWDDKKAVEVRALQFKEIRDFLDSHKKTGVPQILGGDLNVDSLLDPENMFKSYLKDREYSGTLNILNMNSGPVVGDVGYTSGFKTICYKQPGKNEPLKLLDHILVDENDSGIEITERKVVEFKDIMKTGIECPLSDHHGIEAIIRI